VYRIDLRYCAVLHVLDLLATKSPHEKPSTRTLRLLGERKD
jgi:hypothetical protein